MGEIIPFPLEAVTAVTPSEGASFLARLRATLFAFGTTSDALLMMADMADEASAYAAPRYQADWLNLADLLSDAAPAFSEVPLSEWGLPFPSPQFLLAAARCIRESGAIKDQGAARLLEGLARGVAHG